MKRITYIISDIDKALPFEWLADALKDDYHLEFILIKNGESQLKDFLQSKDISVFQVESTSFLSQVRSVYKHLKTTSPDIIHCHLRRAEIVGIPSSFMAGIKARIFTRHSSTYNHIYHRKGVWIDRGINRLATHIIAISQVVRDVLFNLEGVKESKIIPLPHGFPIKDFDQVSDERVNSLKQKYALTDDTGPVIGIIARYTSWKGYQFIIPALARIYEKYPDSRFIFANANGNDKLMIKKLLSEHLEKPCYIEIEYERDIAALYHLFNVYIHCPIDDSVEAFGQTYVEALASGIPSVFTLSGIAHEFIEDGKNALVVPFRDAESIYESTIRLLSDKKLGEELRKNGMKSVQRFNYEDYISSLKQVYEGL